MGPSPERLSWENTLHLPQVQRSNLEATMTEFSKVRAEMENSRAQMAKSSLKETIAELRRGQAYLAMVQVGNERSIADLDYVQNGLPRFHTHNEISQPPQEKMTNLEATMAEWRRFQDEFEISQANFMEEMNQPP